MNLFVLQTFTHALVRKSIGWQASDRFANLLAMGALKTSRKSAPLPLHQRQRRRPSRVKSRPPSPGTPSENLKLALELSDLCHALREAGRKKI
jgi:hypothetical protein